MTTEGRRFELVIEKSNANCKLVSLSVDIRIDGYLSSTAVTMQFLNETPQETAGEVVFPLGDGCAISGYAVDIQGVLVDGVIAERDKSRVAFESEARDLLKKPQASLAEHVVGNIFKSRITPLPKLGTRTIKVTYVEELRVSQGVATYGLPLDYPYSIQDYTVKVSVGLSEAGVPVVENDMEVLQMAKEVSSPVGGQYQASWENIKNQSIKKGVFITIPLFQQAFIVEKRMDDIFFAINDNIDSHLKEETGKPSGNSSIGILWDSSYSRRNPETRKKDIAILSQFLKQIGNRRIDLYVFRDVTQPKVTFNITNGDVTSFILYLEDLRYDGGTSLVDLPITGSNSFYVLFSDGISTLSAQPPRLLLAPVYVIATMPDVDQKMLKIIAKKSGGDYLRVLGDTSIDYVCSRIGKVNFGYISASYDKNCIEEMYPSIPTTLQGKNFKIAGKISSKNTKSKITIQLNFGYGTKITKQIPYTLSIDNPHSTGLVSKFWAQRKIDELLLFPEMEQNNDLILQLGKQYSIVTPNTSFIVLETLEQYLKYEIEPPESLPDIRAKWRDLMNQKVAQALNDYEERMNYVLDLWKRRCSWWNSDEANPEKSQNYIIHCAAFGKGIDEVQKVLSQDWISHLVLLDAQKKVEELIKQTMKLAASEKMGNYEDLIYKLRVLTHQAQTNADIQQCKDKAKDSDELVKMTKEWEREGKERDAFISSLAALEKGTPFTVEFRYLLSASVKSYIGSNRGAVREQKEKKDNPDTIQKFDYNETAINLQPNLIGSMLAVIEKLDKIDLSACDPETAAFFYKMKADQYRYLSEFDKKKYAEDARRNYEKAINISDTHLYPTNPVRLGISLNASVFYYEIMDQPIKACELSKKAFDDSIAKLDDMSEDSYKDSTLIMQLLRDNLTLWIPEDDEEDVEVNKDTTPKDTTPKQEELQPASKDSTEKGESNEAQQQENQSKPVTTSLPESQSNLLELNPNEVSTDGWITWRKRQEEDWADFEKKHFCTSEILLNKWNNDRKNVLQQRTAFKMNQIETENRQNLLKDVHLNRKNLVKVELFPEKRVQEGPYDSYVNSRPSDDNPNYFLEWATTLFMDDNKQFAVRALSTLAEISFDNPQYLRIIAFKLMSMGNQFNLTAIDVLRKVLKIRPEEPVSYLYLGIMLSDNANQLMLKSEMGDNHFEGMLEDDLEYPTQVAKRQYSEALELFNKILKGTWDKRFNQIELTVLEEINRIFAYLNHFGLSHEFSPMCDVRIFSPVAVDLRICIMWDTDMTDVELEVVEPSGEKCYSFNNKTRNGGMMSRNFSCGHGPQEYLIRSAASGKYAVFLKLYSGLSQFTGTNALVSIWTHFADPIKENKTMTLVRIKQERVSQLVSTIQF